MARLLLKNLQPGVLHKIQLRSVEGDSVSEWSRLFDLPVDVDGVAPDAPVWDTPDWVASGDTFIATWLPLNFNLDQNLDFWSYEIQLSDGTTTRSFYTQNTSYTLTFENNRNIFGTAKPTVTARVRSVDASGNYSAWTSTESATNAPPAPPTAPSVGSVATAGADSVGLAWTAPADDDLVGYRIYTGTTAGFTPTNPGNKIFDGDATRFTYNTTTYSMQYFKIFSVDKFNQESSTSLNGNAQPASSFTVDAIAPATPTGLTATMVTSADAKTTQANLTWAANGESDLAGYRIRYRKNGDTNWSYTDAGSDVTAASIFGLQPYVNYDFQIQAYDFVANESAASGTVTGTGATNSAPSQPQAPGVVSSAMRIQVTPTGLKQTGGTAMEADVNYYEVFASTTNGFTEGPTNQIGTIAVGPAMVETFPIPAAGGTATQTWYVKVKAVDNGGLKSTASPQATSTPGLIDSTNIVDLAVTNAKITSLVADKITAGSGIINDITVKSKLTLGDASNVGTIETYDYTTSGGTTGASFSKNGIIIKTGAIEAPALRIQVGQNIMPSAYATMDLSYSATLISYTGVGTISPSMDTVQYQYPTQSMKLTVTTGAAQLILSPASTNNNIKITETGAQWIASMWVRPPTGVTTMAIATYNNGTLHTIANAKRVTDDSTTLVANTWQRVYMVTGVIADSEVHLRVTFPVTGDWNIDGIQFEKLSPGNTSQKPSTWYPPAITTIDGGMIKTGEIRSTNNQTVNNISEPVWSIPLNGSATFQALRVLGNTVLGNGPTDNQSLLSSSNYVPDVSGWQLKATGEAFFKHVSADGFTGEITARNTDIASDGLGSTVTLSGGGFFVKGSDAKGNPEYITFPTSGAPNIISGTLQAETLTVSGLLDPDTGIRTGAAFRGISHFELGSELMLDNAISQPLSAPAVTETTPKVTFSGGPTSNVFGGYYNGGKFYRVQVEFIALSSTNRLIQYSASGAWESTTAIPKPAAPSGGTMSEAEIGGMVKMGSSWYFLWTWTGVNQNVLSKHDGTTLALQSKVDVNQTNNSQAWALGADNTDILIAHWNPHVNDGAARVPYVVHHNATTLATTGTIITLGAYPSATTSATRGGGLGGVLAGEFDYGSGNKTYIVAFNHGTEGATSAFYAYNSSGTRVTDREWPVEKPGDLVDNISYSTGHNTAGGDFYHTSYMNSNTYKYISQTWTSSDSSSWGFGYSWYQNVGRTVSVTLNGTTTFSFAAGAFSNTDLIADISGTNIPAGAYILSLDLVANTGTMSAAATGSGAVTATIAYETKVSPYALLTAKKRRTYTMTGVSGPSGTVVRAYIGRGGPPLMKRQATLAGGMITHSTEFSPANFTTSLFAKGVTTFAAGTPARVYTQQTYSYTITGITVTNGSATLSATTAGVLNFGQHMVGAAVSGTNIPAGTKILSVATDRATATMSANATTGTLTNQTLTLTQPSIELKGSGFVNVEQLYARGAIFTSTQDVNATAGNMPPLRIGDINDDHLRIDGNEIQAMNDDDTVGGLLVNAAGGTIKLGVASTPFTTMRMGTTSDATNANGDLSISHGLGAVPNVILVNGRGQEGTANLYMPWDGTSTTFKVRVRVSSTGAPVGTGTTRTVDWIAFV
jgi:hypothetical protein